MAFRIEFLTINTSMDMGNGRSVQKSSLDMCIAYIDIQKEKKVYKEKVACLTI